MRKEYGLEALLEGFSEKLTVKKFAKLLLDDLKNCQCLIVGKTVDETDVILAKGAGNK